MSKWIAITIADLYNSQVAPLIDAANSVALGANQADRVTGTIADVTLEIRRKVAKSNSLDMDGTKIPGGLKTLAIDIIYCRLKTALQMELSQDERDTLKRRVDDLDRIADGKDMVDSPDNPEPSGAVMQSANPVESHAQPRKATAHKLGGLI